MKRGGREPPEVASCRRPFVDHDPDLIVSREGRYFWKNVAGEKKSTEKDKEEPQERTGCKRGKAGTCD